MELNKFVGERIKYFRTLKNITQDELAEKLDTTKQSISRYEIGGRKLNNQILFDLATALNVTVNDFFPPTNCSGDFDDIVTIGNYIRTPVLGYIKAGIPIDAQEDLLGFIDLPEKMFIGGRDFFGLKISGDSMSPDYKDGEIVIFEKTNDIEMCNGEDCAVMVNCTECTFKRFQYDKTGITLFPYNHDYDIKHYTLEQAETLPIRVIGIADSAWRKIKRKNHNNNDDEEIGIIH